MALTRIRAQQISNIDYKQSVRVVTTTNITLAGSAPNTVDGVSLAANNRILVTGQTTGSQNGLYYVTTVGTGSNGTWTRTSDGDTTGEIDAGMIVMVTEGTVYADTQWKLTTNDPITIGTTALTFVQNYLANSISDSISAGTSNVTVGSSANVTISSAGTANVLTISSTGTVVSGTESVTGNIQGGNLRTAGLVSATGSITGASVVGGVITGSSVSVTGAVTGASLVGTITTAAQTNITSVGTLSSLSVTGNVQGGNLRTAGLVSATGAITGASLVGTITTAAQTNITSVGTLSSLSVTGNVQGGNLNTAGLVSATGNIITSSRLGIGTSAPTLALDIYTATPQIKLQGTGTSAELRLNAAFGSADLAAIGTVGGSPLMLFTFNTERMRIDNAGVTTVTGTAIVNANSTTDALRITQTGTGKALLVEDSTNPDATPFVISASGQVIAGTTTAPTTGLFSLDRSSNDTGGTAFDSSKNRAGAIVQNNDTLFLLRQYGYDGASYVQAAQIAAVVDGTPGTNDMPGRLVFSTTADGASSPTERMRINNAGVTTVTGTAIVNANSTTDALRITQTGTGKALLVEDSTNPDATPFVVQNDGRTLLGSTTSYSGVFNAAFLQAHAVGGNGTIDGFRYTADEFGVDIGFLKSRSATTGTQTVVQSGDALGVLRFAGSDGAAFKQAATISAFVDGTPGTNDMPGRLVFATTADGASSPTERMRIDSAGNVGIGGVPLSYESLIAAKNITGFTSARGIVSKGQIQSGVTSGADYFRTEASTQAATFTSSFLTHYSANQGTFGLNSTVTNQYGFVAESTLTGATNNYGFYSNIASGTGRWNFYASGTANNYFAGNVGIGSTSLSNVNFRVSSPIAGTSTAYGAFLNGAIQPTVVSASYITTGATTAANGGTPYTTIIRHFSASQGTINADSTVSNQYGFAAESSLTGATNNYGFYSNIASGTGRWNFYANGTAANVFAGTTHIGGTVGAESLRVTPVASAVNYWEAVGAATSGSIGLYARGSDANVGMIFVGKGNGQTFFNNNSANQFAIGATASAVNYLQVSGASNAFPKLSAQGSFTNIAMMYVTKGNQPHLFQTNGGVNQFAIAHTASAVNYLQAQGNATGSAPFLSAQGSDTNINMFLSSKGTGSHVFSSGGGTQFVITNAASAVNNLYVTGSAAGTGVLLAASGSDTNIDIRLLPKGTGGVAIGATSAGGYKLYVNGSFAATTKSFVIDHPTKPNMMLRYGSLEGPENGVYVRGRLTGNNTIELPDYWTGLVDPDTITVNLTPIGRHQNLYIEDIADNKVIVGNESTLNNINCFYTVFAERKDVEKLLVEFENTKEI